ncbi:MAG: DNA helicase II [Arenicellaceae bacterium]|nr:DNA helicase II [Arenicellaceae bacterium]
MVDVSHIFDGLNDAQRDAVALEPGPALIIAGAGSGKTRVLTSRIAWLVEGLNTSPLSILAVTFTNKAAREMQNRIEQMLGVPVGGMWMGTFHGLAHRLLRHHHEEAGLQKDFQILDSDDQLRLIKRALKELALDEAYWPAKQIQWFINSHKEEGRRAAQIAQTQDLQQQTLLGVYEKYENLCHRFGLVDFSELLLRAYELIRNNEVLQQRYQQRFQHILVDEFQDTNSIQYEWLTLLVAKHKNLFVVGDDDQSIYGWRGAKVENILQFEKDFPTTRTVRLEQNYRSTGNILAAANAVIEQNSGRLGKKLWTADDDGDPVQLYTAYNESDEARFVIDRIHDWVNGGGERAQTAILYRSNAQSRVFEEILLDAGMPYRVYGGLRFFERAEIKDALAYLRLASSHDNDVAFERIVNTPTRGIGNTTLEKVRTHAQVQQISIWDATRQMLAQKSFAARAHSALDAFIELIEELGLQLEDQDLPAQISAMLEISSLLEHHKKDKSERGQARTENLEELVSAARHFSVEDEDLGPLSSFLSHAALEAGEGQAEEWEDCVQLMSLHSAKGLEFNLVFLTGLEEGLFPHQRSIDEPGRLEEERRLCYVGMTRAMKHLYLSHAEVRRLYGQEKYTSPSRFLDEIPEAMLNVIRATRQSEGPAQAATSSPAALADTLPGFGVGTLVTHPKFGEGVIMNVEGQGEYARVQVNFSSAGSKWLVSAYANLSAV